MTTPVILPSLTPLLIALEENLHRHVAFVPRAAPGMKLFDRPDLLMVDSGLAADTFNKVCRARLDESNADRRISDAVEYFRDARRPFTWWVGPGSRPLDLEARLVARGFRSAESQEGMAMELDRLPAQVDEPGGLRVRRVGSTSELADFSKIFAANWEPPDLAALAYFASAASALLADDCPMRLFVGYLDGEAVSTSGLFIGGGVAGLYSVATRKEFRRRGLASTMAWAAANAAREAGLATMILQSSPEGRGVYSRLGFRDCCRLAEFVPATRSDSR